MASSLELNKLLSGVLTAGIIAVGAGVIAGILYQTHPLEENAFNVIVPTDEGAGDGATAEAEASGPEPIAVRLASADASAGETITRQCTACHVFQEGGENRVGPGLWNVVGSDIAAHAGFAYSDALQGIEGDWTYEALDGFLAAPRDWAPGTAMSYAGLRDAQDRANLIAYLRTLSNDPVPLPEPEAAAAEAPSEEPAATEAAETDVAAATEQPAEAPAAEAEAAVAEAPAAEGAEPAAETETAAADAAAEPDVEAATEQPADAEAAAPAADADAAAADVGEAEAAAPADTAETEVAAAEPEATEAPADAGGEASPMVAMVSSADPANGERLFRQCAACHVAEQGGANRVGPALWGVYGRDIAAAEGFNYSDALKSLEGSWTVDNLNAYLENPRGFAPGNRMAFAGLRSEEDRAAMIAYLHSLSENPEPLQ